MSYREKSMHGLVGKLQLWPREEDRERGRENKKTRHPDIRNFSISLHTNFLHWESTLGKFYNTEQRKVIQLKRCVFTIIYRSKIVTGLKG